MELADGGLVGLEEANAVEDVSTQPLELLPQLRRRLLRKVVHLIAGRLVDLTPLLGQLATRSRDFH